MAPNKNKEDDKKDGGFQKSSPSKKVKPGHDTLPKSKADKIKSRLSDSGSRDDDDDGALPNG